MYITSTRLLIHTNTLRPNASITSMASWTRSAIAIIKSIPCARKVVEAAFPGNNRIAAHHVKGWLVLQKQWTRAATVQARGMTLIEKKMIEISANGLHVAARHVSRFLFPLKGDATTATLEPGGCPVVVTKASAIPPAESDYPTVSNPVILLIPAQAPVCTNRRLLYRSRNKANWVLRLLLVVMCVTTTMM